MTERKPTGVSWESWTERQIEQGRRAGLFEGLDGAGRPIEGLDGPHDEEWWVKAKLRREEIAYLPPTIAVRADARRRSLQRSRLPMRVTLGGCSQRSTTASGT